MAQAAGSCPREFSSGAQHLDSQYWDWYMTSYDQMVHLKIQSLQFIFLGKWKDTQRSRAQFSNHSRLDFCFKAAKQNLPKRRWHLSLCDSHGINLCLQHCGGNSGRCCGSNSELHRTGMVIAHPCPSNGIPLTQRKPLHWDHHKLGWSSGPA